MVYINDGKNIVQVPRGTWNHTEDPERDNHLFDSHKPFKGKDDVRRLNKLLKKLKGYGGGGYGGGGGSGNGSGGRMRVTYHSGRGHKNKRNGGFVVYTAKHNDRNFKSDADHIVKDKSGNNIEWNWCGNEFTFDEGELKFYEEVFSEQLNYSNESYIKQGHKERIKTMDQWRKSKQHCPEEIIMMIGNIDNHPDVETSVECFKEYMAWLDEWSRQNGRPFKVLNWAMHQDEQGAPHFHIRRVWYYRDYEKHFCTTGQEEALRRTSLKLPNPEKKEGKKNNRKISFDKMCREKMIEIARKHGMAIEDKPKPKEEVGLTLEEFKRRKDKEQVEIYNDLVELAELNLAMAEKVSEWEETAKAVDNSDGFLKKMVEKAYRAYTDEEQAKVVEEIKGYYANEMKKMNDVHQKEIALYDRQLHPERYVKKDRDRGMER